MTGSTRRVRVRFAPSPTGGLHMGGVRTALFNYLFAKKNNGDFILRIEDTDQTRYVTGAEEYIVNSLAWCGIHFDEGVSIGGPHAPYRQSERKEKGIYMPFAEKLIKSGHAYYAFDSAEELETMRKRLEAAKVVSPQYNAISRQEMRNSLTLPESEVSRLIEQGAAYVIRLKVPRNEDIRFHDIIRGWITVNSSTLDDKVLLKSDGMPTYHLAHMVDDYLMDISHIIRGEEWLPSAPSHVLLWRYLGLEERMPQFAHLPLILKADGNGKLSKRDKSGVPMFPLNWHDERTGESYTGYQEEGYFPEAFVNMLALLGWHPGDNRELFSINELIDNFSLERVNKSGARFDPVKTNWFNQQYLRAKPDFELASLFKPILEQSYGGASNFNDFKLEEFCRLMKEKVTFIHEFWEQGAYFFVRPDKYDEQTLSKKFKPELLPLFVKLSEAFQELNEFTHPAIEQAFKDTCSSMGINPGQVMQLLRVAISGVSGGPALFELCEWLGEEEVNARLINAANAWSAL